MVAQGMEWAIFGSLFIFVFILLAIVGEHLRQRRKMAIREMLLKERMAAMEKGLPLPEWDSQMLEEGRDSPALQEHQQRKLQWFRFTALCVGIVLVFGGLGMTLAFGLSGDADFRQLASIGIIPTMTGLGLLLFYFLTRNQFQ